MSDPKSESEYWNQAGRTSAKSGDLENALRNFDRALLTYSQNANALYNKGVVLTKLSRYEEALECYTKALNLAPNDKEIQFRRSEVMAMVRERRSQFRSSQVVQNEQSTQQEASVSSGNPNSSKEGVVYLLRMGKHHKIGKTTNIERRYSQLKIQLPEKSILVHEIKTNNIDWLERHWHNVFREKRTNGEWFSLDGKDVTEFLSCVRLDVEISQSSR